MIIDTNVYSALSRGAASAIELVAASKELRLPLPVIAELRFGFVNGSRQEENEERLQQFLAQSRVAVIYPTLRTTNFYAELELLCVRKGCALSQNDLWIAALAREADDTLATFDRDFETLSDIFGEKLVILD